MWILRIQEQHDSGVLHGALFASGIRRTETRQETTTTTTESERIFLRNEYDFAAILRVMLAHRRAAKTTAATKNSRATNPNRTKRQTNITCCVASSP